MRLSNRNSYFKKEVKASEEENSYKLSKLFQSPILSAIIKASSAYFLVKTVMHSNAFNAKILAAWLTKANAIALGKTWLFDHETYEAAMVQWEFIVKAIIVGSAVVIVASELFRLISEKIAETKTEHNLEKLNSTAIAETTQKAAIGERASLDKYKIKEKEIKMEKEESTANWFLFGNLAATGCYLLIGSYLKTHKEAFAIGFVAAEVGLAAVQLVYLIYEAAKYFTAKDEIPELGER